MKTAWRQDRTARFKILHRDRFACRYCGAMPGSDALEVDHLIPRSRGGSDHDINKVTACKTCNGRKSNTIVFPHDLIERMDDEEGWYVHKTFGEWSIVFCDDAVGVEKQLYGFIEGKRLFDDLLMMHLYSKPWGHSVFRDMEMAFANLRQMLKDPRR
jgi:hypothetical protein